MKISAILVWVKETAINQLVIFSLITVGLILFLSVYHVSFQYSTTEIQDNVEIVKNIKYVFHSVIEKEGAKVCVKSCTYMSKNDL
jgi:hypothetical protein